MNTGIFSKKASGIIDRLIKSTKEGHKSFKFTDVEDLHRYLGVDIVKHKDRLIEITQLHLIERLVSLVEQEDNIKTKITTVTKPMLHKNITGLDRKIYWNYRQVVGMLTYMKETYRTDASLVTHQGARLCINPKLFHKRAIHIIGRYLKGTNPRV